jgi:hypothetical protein
MDLPEEASPLDALVKTKLKLGLFSYPVLQAADILVHRYRSSFLKIRTLTELFLVQLMSPLDTTKVSI